MVALIIGLGGGYFIAQSQAPVLTHSMPADSSMSNAMAGMTSGLTGRSGDEFDKAFLAEMIVHHEGAVEMARQALQHAQHTEIKQMAQDIIDAQEREITTMRGWQQSWYGSRQ